MQWDQASFAALVGKLLQELEDGRWELRQAAELAALLGEPISRDGGETQPRIYHYHRTADGELAVVQMRYGGGRHRIELTLPHDETLAVVQALVAVWG